MVVFLSSMSQCNLFLCILVNPYYELLGFFQSFDIYSDGKFKDFTKGIQTFFENIHQHKQQLSQFIGLKFKLFEFEKNSKTIFS